MILLSMGFSRQEYWSGLPHPPPGDLPIPGIQLRCPALQADSLPSEPPQKPIHLPKSYREVDRQTDRQTAGWIDGWMDGWMDRQINSRYSSPPYRDLLVEAANIS